MKTKTSNVQIRSALRVAISLALILLCNSGQTAVGFLLGGDEAPKISIFAAAGTMATGLGVSWMLNQPDCKKPQDPWMPVKVAGALSLVELGDESQGGNLSLQTLTDEAAKKIGLSEDEKKKWNEHIHEVRALQDEVNSYVAKNYSQDCMDLQMGRLKTNLQDQVGRTKAFIDTTIKNQNWGDELKSAYQKVNEFMKSEIEK